MTKEEQRLRSMEITRYFLGSVAYTGSHSVHLYESMQDEVNTLYILDHIKLTQRELYFPTKDPYQNHATDVIVVPGRKFDKYMNRQGRGRGYYDRFLANTNAIKVGICYESQLTRDLNTKPHDIPMDMIITEMGIYTKQHEEHIASPLARDSMGHPDGYSHKPTHVPNGKGKPWPKMG